MPGAPPKPGGAGFYPADASKAELERWIHSLPEPERALPTLDQIAGDPRFVEIGRQRARNLAERIRHQS